MIDPVDATRVWLITGASSGFGLAIAQAALGRGDTVVATSRRVDAIPREKGERIALLPLDVTDADQRRGAVEETTDEELRDLFELHFFAPDALTRAVLPQMRKQGGGTIVQMSSVGGQVTAAGFGA